MHIRVLPPNIPKVWEAVKYAVVQLDEIPNEQLPDYFVWLLQQLLSEKAQCWITLNEDRVLLNVSITRITTHPFTKEKVLHIQCLYAFQGLTDTTVAEALSLYKEFAKSVGCRTVTGASRHPRACTLMEKHHFQPEYKTYTLAAEG